MPEIRVQDEQGNVHVFPDGSTPEMIAKVLNVKPPAAQAAPAPRTWLDSVKDFGGEFFKQVNPVTAVQGLRDAAAHPIDTAKAMGASQDAVRQKAEASFKKGDYAEGVRHVLNYLVPVLGPQTDQAGDLAQRGQLAKAAGQTAGLAANIAAPELIKGANIKLPVGELPERMYQSALKPSTTLGRAKTAQVISTGLNEGIPVSQEGVEKIGKLVSDLRQSVKDTIASQPGATVNKFSVASRLGDTAQKFSRQVNPAADLNAIGEAGNEFLASQPGQIPAADAQALKTGTYQQLKGKAYGELKGASIEAQKALARGLKEELEIQFPEIKGWNAREGQLIGLDKSLERAVARIENHQMLGIGTPIAATAGAAVAGGPGAAVAGLMKFVFDQPEIKSKLAIALSHAGKGQIPVSAAMARIAGYSNALGNAVSGGTPNQ